MSLKRKRLCSKSRLKSEVKKKKCIQTESESRKRFSGIEIISETRLGPKTIQDLNDDVLLIVFGNLNFKQSSSTRGVCHRWRALIDYSIAQKQSLSFVNSRKDLSIWREENWYELSEGKKDFTKVDFENVTDLVTNVIAKCPKLRTLDMECFDMKSKSMRLIGEKCPQLERINFDSSDGLNVWFAQNLTKSLSRLKYLNVSCCRTVNEEFVQQILNSLPDLIALNICGTNITGNCLSLIGANLIDLNISYCWELENNGLMALTSAHHQNLRHLSINNFNFTEANGSLESICNTFRQLKTLDMSFGSCTGPDFYLNSLGFQGFSSIARLSQLEKLIIRKNCILDDPSLLAILSGCRLLRHLVIDMYGEHNVTDFSVSQISRYCQALEYIEISNNTSITGNAVNDGVRGLNRLKKLILRFLNIDNKSVIFVVKNCQQLSSICLNGCLNIKKQTLIETIKCANSKPNLYFEFEAIGTQISVKSISRGNVLSIKNIPNNIEFKVSHWRANRYIEYKSGRITLRTKPKSI